MPTKRRVVSRNSRLTRPMPHETEPPSRERWERWRDELMPPNINPGCRHDGWWAWELPEPRDYSIQQMLQLYRLGQLQGEELEACKREWCRHEEYARQGWVVLAPGKILRGAAAYFHIRKWAGIPDDVIPPDPSAAIAAEAESEADRARLYAPNKPPVI